MQIQPILAALRKHRLSTILIALEIALACAVLCNACFMITQRISAMHVDSGVDEAALATVQLTGYEPAQAGDVDARVLAAMRAVPGVQSASLLNSIPFGSRRGTAGLTTDAAGQHFGGVVEFYVGGPGSLHALGAQVVAGRASQPDDFQPFTGFMPDGGSVQITQSLAEHLWPGVDPLGKEFWVLKSHFRVVGVLKNLVRPDPLGWAPQERQWSVFVPAQPGPYLTGSYLLRANPADLPRVMRDVLAAVAKAVPNVVIDRENSHALTELRHDVFKPDRAMTGMLIGVIVALLLVTALGIVGLASFWVQQRQRQIGIRRAIGATRGDILRYFQTENFLIVSGGIALGMLLAYGLNLVLMQHYELPRLPAYYLPIGALVLWALGQLAVLGPALRAAAVPPVVATRSV
ncbi:FtsX-like permease family protein [Rhodanobacter sp. AS-Z3]|uniref:ABC transporter permease n=1 Tax=Rhodanobacter sp. AS-Z3 TaxID=3031330 RepID=UPI0024790F26|nr:FtsX-like permease family protein [Rhodanobacter sp. AS-Z3]WEN16233.1 FtsX-like permease family protein [Rhodanobacter sp. AS-Z3]